MNWNFIIQTWPLYWQALLLTLNLAFWGISGSILLGLVVSLIRYYKIPILSPLSQVYIELSRNTPLLIQLFFLYFGLPKLGVVLSAEVCAIAGLTFLGGSYMAESFRSGLESVTKNQIQMGLALGLREKDLLRYVILPQAWAVTLPSFTANLIFLIKETSVFSTIALADLMYVAKDLIGIYYETDEALLSLVFAYLLILLPLSLAASWLERRVRYAGYGNTRTLPGK